MFCDHPHTTSPSHTIPLFICILLSLVAAPTLVLGQIEVGTVFGNSLPAYLIWDGSATISIYATSPVQFRHFQFSPGSAFRDQTFTEQTTPQTSGFTAFKSAIIPVQPETSTIASGLLQLTLKAARGFVITQNTTIKVDVSYYCGLSDGDVPATFVIVPSPEKNTMLQTLYSGANEDEVRRVGFSIQVDLLYNRFSSNAVDITIVSSVGFPAGFMMSSFTKVLKNNDTTLLVTTPPIPQYNLSTSEHGSITLTIPTTSLLSPYLSPNSAQVSTSSIDNQPRAFCTSNVTTINEGAVTFGASVVLALTLSSGADLFRVDTNGTGTFPADISAVGICSAILNEGITLYDLPAMNITCLSATPTTVVLSISTAKDISFSGYIVIIVPPRVLQSADAGCGIATISVYPDPGIITGPTVTPAFTETDINNKELQIVFNVTKDVVVSPKYYFTQTSLVETTRTDSISHYFQDTAALNSEVVISNGGSTVTLTLHPTPGYNIEYDTTETIQFAIYADGLQTNVDPVLIRCEFTISGVTPQFNVTIGNISNTVAYLDDLWHTESTPVYVWLNIQGDRWDNASASKWTYRHPFFSGTTAFDTLHTNSNPALEFDKLSIVDGGHTAIVPFRTMEGFSLGSSSLVFVSQLVLLLEGSQEMSAKSFEIIKGTPSAITGSFSGIARDLTLVNLINETTIRNGAEFQITLKGEIFSNFSTISPYLLLSPSSSLYQFPNSISATLNALQNNLSVTIAPIPAFDIDSAETMFLTVPSSMFANVVASPSIIGRIVVDRLPGPTCFVDGLSNITELNIQQGTVQFQVRSTTTFVTDISSLSPGITSRSGALVVSIVSRTSSNTLLLQLSQNASYNIIEPDNFTISLNRYFFTDKERCVGTFSFSILVQAGDISFSNTMDGLQERDLREGRTSVVVTAFVAGERASTVQSVSIFAVPQYPTSASTNNLYKEILRVSDGGTGGFNTTWSETATEDRFTFNIPQLTNLDILSNESVAWKLPSSIFESGRAPTYQNNILLVMPNAENVSVSLVDVITEGDAVAGGIVVVFNTTYDGFNTTSAATYIRSNWQLLDSGGVPHSTLPLEGLFPLSSFSVNRTHIVMISAASPAFDVEEGNWTVQINLVAGVMLSSIAPATSTASFIVVSGSPSLIYSGTAINGGLRDLILGNLYLDITLVSDTFRSTPSTAICPLPCTITMGSFLKTIHIAFTVDDDFYLSQQTNYTIRILNTSVLSGTWMNNITLSIGIQGGILDEISELPTGTEFLESSFRAGSISSLLLNIRGDKFKSSSSSDIATAIANGIVCTPQIDSYDFCHRFPYMISKVVVGITGQQATVYLQADESFDIASKQVVSIGMTGVGFVSSLAPILSTPITITINPVAGSVYSQLSTTTVSSDNIAAEGTTDTALPDINVALMFTLYGERFIANPTSAILSGFLVQPADQVSGFAYLRNELFSDAIVSSDRRQATLHMKRSSNYYIEIAELVTLVVPALAVESGLTPTTLSSSKQLTIQLGGGHLQLTSASVLYAADVQANGVTVTLYNTIPWDSLYVTELNLGGIFTSDKTAGEEPNGYARYSNTMVATLPNGVTTGSNTLVIHLAAASGYSLSSKERIYITPLDKFNSNNAPFLPTSVSFQIDPAYQPMLVVYGSSLSDAELSSLIGIQVGVVSARVVVSRSTTYGDTNNAFRIAYVVIVNSAAAGGSTTTATDDSIAAAEAFVLTSTNVLSGCCNVSLVFWAASAPSISEMDVLLGLAAAPTTVEEDNSLLWVYISLGFLALIILAGGIFFYIRRKSTEGGRHRVQSRDGDSELDVFTHRKIIDTRKNNFGGDGGGGGKEVLLLPPDPLREEEEESSWAIEGNEFSGPSLSASPINEHKSRNNERALRKGFAGNHRVTVEVDESLHSGQPTSVLRQNIQYTYTPQSPTNTNDNNRTPSRGGAPVTNSPLSIRGFTEEQLTYNPEDDGIAFTIHTEGGEYY